VSPVGSPNSLAIAWRIRLEENALLKTLGDNYRSYAADHKRLVPLVW
jgi:protein-S-isoprenylcysteine O-methyltransferase Ste14